MKYIETHWAQDKGLVVPSSKHLTCALYMSRRCKEVNVVLGSVDYSNLVHTSRRMSLGDHIPMSGENICT